MKLKNLIPKVISQFERIQLVSARSGDTLTFVTYVDGANAYDATVIEALMDKKVFGISSDKDDKGEPFIRIMIVDY